MSNQSKLPSVQVQAILWSQYTYWVAMAISIWAYRSMPKGGVRTVLILMPIAPALLIFSVAYWLYEACDEYIRLRVLKAATTTALILAVLMTIYCFLEMIGYPRLSMVWICMLGWSLFIAQMLKLIWQR